MSDAELWSAWRIWMIVAAIVVAAAAALLVDIWLTARRILADAVRALAAVDAIRAQTLPIWDLQDTNIVAGEVLTTVRSIEARGGALAGALNRHEVRQ